MLLKSSEMWYIVLESDDSNWMKWKVKYGALHGHSEGIAPLLSVEERDPPEYLYHGTVKRSMVPIQAEGLRGMARMFVHLAENPKDAVEVGRRHGRDVVLLRVSAQRMVQSKKNVVYKRSSNGVWLVDAVPFEYCEEIPVHGIGGEHTTAGSRCKQ